MNVSSQVPEGEGRKPVAGTDNRIHPGVINFHEVAIEAVTLMHGGLLGIKDLQWLRADARMVLNQAQQLLDTRCPECRGGGGWHKMDCSRRGED